MRILSDVLDLLHYSDFSPKRVGNEVDRSTTLELVTRKFDSNDLIFLEGYSGIGKSILARQFCENEIKKTVSIFIRKSKPISWDPIYLMSSLIEQFSFLLEEKTPRNMTEKDQNELQNELTRLIRRATRAFSGNKSFFYIVIDGLYHIPEDRQILIEELIINPLPISLKGVKFLVTVDNEQKTSDFFENRIREIESNVEYVSVHGFSDSETATFFKNVSKDEIVNIRKHFKGSPRDITLFSSQYNGDDSSLNNLPADLFALMWGSNNIQEEEKNIIATIVFAEQVFNLEELSEITEISTEKIRAIITESSFLNIENKEIEIVNDDFYQKLREELVSLKKKATSDIANWIIEKNDKRNLMLLPTYLESSEKYYELFDFLDNPENINHIIASESMSSVRMLVEKGFNVSETINSFGNQFKFSVETSLFREKDVAYKKKMLEALFSIDKVSEAEEIAHTEAVLENKIELLSLLARLQKEKHGDVDPELISKIKSLYKKLKLEFIGERGINIASELMFVDSDLATELLEQTYSLENDENSLDKIMVNMTLRTIEKSSSMKNQAEKIDILQKNIKNKEFQQLFSEFSSFLQSNSPEEMLEEIKKMKSVNGKIQLLASWCENNKSSKKSVEVIETAFSLINESKYYRSNAGIYRQVSEQMFEQTVENTKKLTDLFSPHLETLKENGPNMEYIHLCLNIAKANKENNKEETLRIVEDLYSFVDAKTDSVLKLEGYSSICSVVIEMEQKVDEFKDILELICLELDSCVEKILGEAGNHSRAFSKSLRILAASRLNYCKSIVKKVNTRSSRDHLYYIIAKGLINELDKDNEKSCYLIEEVLNIIPLIEASQRIKDAILEFLVYELFLLKNNDELTLKDKHFNLIKVQVLDMKDLAKKVEALNFLSCIGDNEAETKKIEDEAILLWGKIDLLPLKIDVGLESISQIKNKRQSLTNLYYDKIYRLIQDDIIIGEEEFWNNIFCVRLLIRSFKGILRQETISEEYQKKITEIIGFVNSVGEEAILWADLAANYYQAEDLNEVKSISVKIRDLLKRIPKEDTRYKNRVINVCAPILYVSHERSFEPLLEDMSISEKDETYFEISTFLLTGLLSTDPINNDAKLSYSTSYEKLYDVCSIIRNLDNDGLQHGLIERVLDALNSNKVRIKKESKDELSDNIKKIINEVFPSQNNIKHKGYQVTSESSFLNKTNGNERDIDNLLKKSELIDNIHDQIYVNAAILKDIEKPKLFNTVVKRVLEKSDALIEKLSNVLDRIDAYEIMANSLERYNPQESKKYIEKGINFLVENKNESDEIKEKSLIEMAYQIDEEFGNSMVSVLSSETDNGSLTNMLEKEKEFNATKKEMINNDLVVNTKKIEYAQALQVSKVSWDLLSRLNVSRITPKKITEMPKVLFMAKKLPIKQAYPIYSWLLENNNRKNSSKGIEAELFDALYRSCVLAFWKQPDRLFPERVSGLNESISIGKENMEEAEPFILDWIKKNAKEEIIICDPYFSNEQLEIIYKIFGIDSNLKFEILTSIEQINKKITNMNVGEFFTDYWYREITDEEPSQIKITVAGKRKGGKLIIHDRFIISGEKGLSIGMSFNGLTSGRDYTIQEMSYELVQENKSKIMSYLTNNQVYFKSLGEVVDVSSYLL